VCSGCRRGPLEPAAGPMPNSHDRQARDERHGGDRARQPTASRGACRGLRRAGLDKQRLGTDRCDRHDRTHPPAKARACSCEEPSLRGSCWAGLYEYFLTRFASAEGKNGGSSTRPRLCGALPCVGDLLSPTKGPHLHPCLRLGRSVRAEREGSWKSPRRPLGDISATPGEQRHAPRRLA